MILVLLVITTLCVLAVIIIGVMYRRRKVHKHTRLPLAVHYLEYNNTILDWLKCYDH